MTEPTAKTLSQSIELQLDGQPDVPNRWGSGSIRPERVFFYYLEDRVSAHLFGSWIRPDGEPTDDPVDQLYRGEDDGWPDWLTTMARKHVPTAARFAPAVWIDGHPQLEAIAAAVWERCRHDASSSGVDDDPRNIAVAALAAMWGVQPPPADRAAVPAELKAIVDRAAGRDHSADGAVMACLAEVLAVHRAMLHGETPTAGPAAEAPEPATQAEAPCPDPIECSHEAALGQARETNRRLNLRAQALESELATYRRAVAQWEVSERGTYVPLRTVAAIAKAAGRDIESPRWLLHYLRVEQAEAAIKRVLDWVATLDTLAVQVHGPGTRHPVADHVRDLLDATPTDQPAVAPAAGQTGEEA